MVWRGVIDRYREYLPIGPKAEVVTLNEGNTPLVHATKISKEVGSNLDVYLKYEGSHPTGSFKDRGMTVAVTKAVEEGCRATICASTGNTSASAAAYSARAGIKSIVIIPKGRIALGKRAQAMIYGALVIEIEGNFDDALRIVREIGENYPVTIVNSINPYRLQGQKTAAFEICDQLGGRAPDYHALPVGNAGNITAYWMGYPEYRDAGKVSSMPVMLGFQAEGAAPIVRGHPIENPETVATAIRIGNPASWKQAVNAAKESGGLITTVTDEEILSAQKMIASLEGVFCEPASAASVAGILKLSRKGYFESSEKKTVVCTLTGNGLKDPNIVEKQAPTPTVLPADTQEVVEFIGL
jgi:threonine synthase